MITLFVAWSPASDCEDTPPQILQFSTLGFEFSSASRYYDVLEDRVPAGLVSEYHSLQESCSRCFQQFSELRSGLSADSDSELDNVSMVEGLKLCEQLETLKRKLHIIENPLLRWVPPRRLSASQPDARTPSPRLLCPGTSWPTRATAGSSARRAAGPERRG